jgi:hypothetical protein
MNLYRFRIDDVSVNTDEEKLRKMVAFLRTTDRITARVEITFAVSPLVFNMSGYDGLEQERVFPRILHVEADYRKFYEADRMGIPSVVQDRRDLQVLIASHGMIHVDHRLMSKRAQELSILTSCSILGTTHFVPPFHKWNKKTARVCHQHKIVLTRFEDENAQHLAYKKFDGGQSDWYFHTHDFTYEQFCDRFS